MDVLANLFPGIGTFFAVEPKIAIARIFLIVLGFVLAYLGFKRTLEPLVFAPVFGIKQVRDYGILRDDFHQHHTCSLVQHIRPVSPP